MTCDEFRSTVTTRTPDSMSRAERAVIDRHADNCPVCADWLFGIIVREAMRTVSDEQREEIRRVVHGDLQDAEYRETYREKKI